MGRILGLVKSCTGLAEGEIAMALEVTCPETVQAQPLESKGRLGHRARLIDRLMSVRDINR